MQFTFPTALGCKETAQARLCFCVCVARYIAIYYIYTMHAKEGAHRTKM